MGWEEHGEEKRRAVGVLLPFLGLGKAERRVSWTFIHCFSHLPDLYPTVDCRVFINNGYFDNHYIVSHAKAVKPPCLFSCYHHSAYFGFSPPDFPHPGFGLDLFCFVLLFCNSLQLLSAPHLTRLQTPTGLVAPTFMLCPHFLSHGPFLDLLSRRPAWPLRARAFIAAVTAMSWSKLTQIDASWCWTWICFAHIRCPVLLSTKS